MIILNYNTTELIQYFYTTKNFFSKLLLFTGMVINDRSGVSI